MLSCILPMTISRVYLLPRQPGAWGPRLSLLASWAGQVNHLSVPILELGQRCTGLTRLPLQSKDIGLRGFLRPEAWDLELQDAASSAKGRMSQERLGAGDEAKTEARPYRKSQDLPHRLQGTQDLE